MAVTGTRALREGAAVTLLKSEAISQVRWCVTIDRATPGAPDH